MSLEKNITEITGIEPKTIEIHSALVGSTEIIVGDNVNTMSQLYMMGTKLMPSISIVGPAVGHPTLVASIPNEIFVNEIWTLGFDYGIHVECTPESILDVVGKGRIPASEVKVGDKVMGGKLDIEHQEWVSCKLECTLSKKEFKVAGCRVYPFLSTSGNLLIPNFHATTPDLYCVCIYQ